MSQVDPRRIERQLQYIGVVEKGSMWALYMESDDCRFRDSKQTPRENPLARPF